MNDPPSADVVPIPSQPAELEEMVHVKLEPEVVVGSGMVCRMAPEETENSSTKPAAATWADVVRAARPLPVRTASMVPEEANGVAGPAGTPHVVGAGTVGVGVFELAAVPVAVPEKDMPVDGETVCVLLPVPVTVGVFVPVGVMEDEAVPVPVLLGVDAPVGVMVELGVSAGVPVGYGVSAGDPPRERDALAVMLGVWLELAVMDGLGHNATERMDTNPPTVPLIPTAAVPVHGGGAGRGQVVVLGGGRGG